MCMMDYKIGARIHPIAKTDTIPASGVLDIPADPNRVGIRLCVGSATTSLSMLGADGVACFIGSMTTSGLISGSNELLLKNQGTITMGPLRLSATAGTTVRWIEYVAERDVIEHMLEAL